MNIEKESHMRQCTMPMLGYIAAIALLTAGASTLAQPGDFDSVKIQADANERTLSEPQKARLQTAQRALLDKAVPDCATPVPQLDPFVIVAQLDASGLIKRTWRRGSTPLAICVERELRGKTLPAPPAAPFLVSFELSFAP
jgi:hypothetical protein